METDHCSGVSRASQKCELKHKRLLTRHMLRQPVADFFCAELTLVLRTGLLVLCQEVFYVVSVCCEIGLDCSDPEVRAEAQNLKYLNNCASSAYAHALERTLPRLVRVGPQRVHKASVKSQQKSWCKPMTRKNVEVLG